MMRVFTPQKLTSTTMHSYFLFIVGNYETSQFRQSDELSLSKTETWVDLGDVKDSS